MAIFKRKKEEDKQSQQPAASGKDKGAGEEKKSMKELYTESDKSKKKTKSTTKKSESKSNYQKAYQVLVKPLITEKAANIGAENKYVFMVSAQANKVEIAKSIDQVYGVKPTKVNILNYEGKKVRFGRVQGRRRDWKKAIVTLPAGKSINVYEGV